MLMILRSSVGISAEGALTMILRSISMLHQMAHVVVHFQEELLALHFEIPTYDVRP